ncbi:unnamed protein product [Spirodela intermedia]|uniref:Uncharacterized protein n=1 Tax=Spirodela intermedia TaxID=51605 RepID=A0A7I8LAS7_SPIIN|nr:unnamed protein product [Spirodela intermedia]
MCLSRRLVSVGIWHLPVRYSTKKEREREREGDQSREKERKREISQEIEREERSHERGRERNKTKMKKERNTSLSRSSPLLVTQPNYTSDPLVGPTIEM